MTLLLKVYKSDLVELSEESFTVEWEQPESLLERLSQLTEQEPGNLAAEDTGESAAPPKLDAREIALILKKTEERAQELLSQARSEAQMEAQSILQRARAQAEQEGEELRRQTYTEAFNHGMADGIAAKARQVEALVSQLEGMIGRIEGSMSGFMAQYEGDLKWAVLEVASKVLDRTLERDDLALLELVKKAVDAAKGAQWIDIHLSDEAVQLIDRLEREMAPMQYITVIPEELPPGSCIVDTPTGRIDASVRVQLENLKDYFASHSAAL